MTASPPPPRRAPRSEPREIAELRQLRVDQPELAEGVDLQIELLMLQRRVQARIPLPWFEIDAAWVKAQHDEGMPLLRFGEIPIEWTELRLLFRQAADILQRFGAIEARDHERLQALARAGKTLEPLVAEWYNAAAGLGRAARQAAGSSADGPGRAPEGSAQATLPVPVSRDALDEVLALAMRPFLERSAESIQQRTDLTSWREPYCPICGGEVEFAVITPSAERLLICGRCSARWRFHALACPFCRNDDRSRITSFTSRDGRYRLYACDVCRRYLKAHDGRTAGRPLLLAVDTIATLPLDAAAIKKGYRA